MVNAAELVVGQLALAARLLPICLETIAEPTAKQGDHVPGCIASAMTAQRVRTSVCSQQITSVSNTSSPEGEAGGEMPLTQRPRTKVCIKR